MCVRLCVSVYEIVSECMRVCEYVSVCECV